MIRPPSRQVGPTRHYLAPWNPGAGYIPPIGPARHVYRVRVSSSGRNYLVDRWVAWRGEWRFTGYLRTRAAALRVMVGMRLAHLYGADGEVIG